MAVQVDGWLTGGGWFTSGDQRLQGLRPLSRGEVVQLSFQTGERFHSGFLP